MIFQTPEGKTGDRSEKAGSVHYHLPVDAPWLFHTGLFPEYMNESHKQPGFTGYSGADLKENAKKTISSCLKKCVNVSVR
jgi:hypothetical protein